MTMTYPSVTSFYTLVWWGSLGLIEHWLPYLLSKLFYAGPCYSSTCNITNEATDCARARGCQSHGRETPLMQDGICSQGDVEFPEARLLR